MGFSWTNMSNKVSIIYDSREMSQEQKKELIAVQMMWF